MVLTINLMIFKLFIDIFHNCIHVSNRVILVRVQFPFVVLHSTVTAHPSNMALAQMLLGRLLRWPFSSAMAFRLATWSEISLQRIMYCFRFSRLWDSTIFTCVFTCKEVPICTTSSTRNVHIIHVFKMLFYTKLSKTIETDYMYMYRTTSNFCFSKHCTVNTFL